MSLLWSPLVIVATLLVYIRKIILIRNGVKRVWIFGFSGDAKKLKELANQGVFENPKQILFLLNTLTLIFIVLAFLFLIIDVEFIN